MQSTSRDCFGIPRRQDPPRSEVYVDGYTGVGSTNGHTAIFPNVRKNVGTAILYQTSPVAGDSFSILEDGVYSISTASSGSGGASTCSIYVLDASKAVSNTSAENLTYATGNRCISTSGDGAPVPASWTGFLSAGQVVRQQNNNATVDNSQRTFFSICKVSS